MEDHHVDRPDVKARQRVKLTGTNRSFDLIALVAKARERAKRAQTTDDRGRMRKKSACFAEMAMGRRKLVFRPPSSPSSVLGRPGGYSEEPIPDPIPNSAVKVLCADGTKPQGLEE